MKFLVILAIAVFVVLFLPFCVCVKYSYDIVQAKYEYNGERCNLEKILDTGDSYIIKRFPPEATVYYPMYSPRGLNPEECTLLFESGDDCILEYRTHHFERGDIYCNEQYFRIGDENAEIMVCGFRKPPSHLSSSGNQLFLTHYSANGHDRRTVASYLSGTVRCIPNKVNHLDAALLSNAVTCLTPLTPLDCFPPETIPFKGSVNVTYVGVFGANQFTVRTICTQLCTVTSTVCFGMQNVTTVEYQSNLYGNNNEKKNCTPPLEPPFMGESTDGCVSLTVPCTRTGDCSGSIIGTMATGGGNSTIPINGDNPTLIAEPNQLGSLIFNVCSGGGRGGLLKRRAGGRGNGRGVGGRNGGGSSNMFK